MKSCKGGLWVGLGVLLACTQVVAAASDQPKAAAANAAKVVRYVRFDVEGELAESRPPVVILPTERETLYELIDRIDKAALDPNVQGVIVRLGTFEAGWAKAQEVRQALLRCRKAGKQVICLLEDAGNMEYYLACAADRVDMVPAGDLMLVGLRLEAIFVRDLLDKIGIKGDFIEVGKYKGGAEELTRTEPSPAFRESLDSLIQNYFDQLVLGIMEGRQMPLSKANTLIRRGPYTAQGAKEAGLVDDVLYYDELVSQLQARFGEGFRVQTDYASSGAKGVAPDATALFRMLMGMGGPPKAAVSQRPVIAVVHASGPIVEKESDTELFGEEMASAESLVSVLQKAAADSRVRAIVLRVDSPGGSALASDMIWRAVHQADARKPVIASFSDTAASGGYYIASGARKIYAEPGTLTGSIGIFGGKLVLADLFKKIGVNVTVIERGGNTGLLSSFQEYTPQERDKLQELLQAGYQLFLERVAATRQHMTTADVNKVAQGRVWTGDQALHNGLVDGLGGLPEAIQAAREAAGIGASELVDVQHLPRSRNLAELLLFGGEGPDVKMPDLLSGLALPPLEGVRGYIGSLMALRRELTVCMMPALVSVR